TKTSKGPFQSQKKNLFHKIVSKYKHKKEKPNVPEKGSGDKWSNKQLFLDAIHPTEEPTTTQEPLVGSQKRKARKTKITH
ncbi:BBX isoform 8, partial [Pan troglodytes]